jgi:hypothetical protein
MRCCKRCGRFRECRLYHGNGAWKDEHLCGTCETVVRYEKRCRKERNGKPKTKKHTTA